MRNCFRLIYFKLTNYSLCICITTQKYAYKYTYTIGTYNHQIFLKAISCVSTVVVFSCRHTQNVGPDASFLLCWSF